MEPLINKMIVKINMIIRMVITLLEEAFNTKTGGHEKKKRI